MSGDVSIRKRLISITGGNLRNNHIYFSGHHDFFPKECYGSSNKNNGIGKVITLVVEGLPEVVHTDISTHGTNGSPRNFFRKREWVRRFFEKNKIREGDVIAIEKIDDYVYHITPFETKNIREGATIPNHWPSVKTGKLTVIDLFAGCGGFSVGLKKAGFENLLAVEWDASCCETFRHNMLPKILLSDN
jgi:hypothetical protein